MFQKIKRLLNENKYMLASFFVPFFIVLVVFADKGFYPFGENQIAVIDMYHQYVPFLAELQSKLQSGGSLLYSWDGGGGTNFVSLLAYYTASPLNLILVLFPQKFVMEGVTLIVLIKVGLAGLFMTVYLKGMHRRCDCATVAFSTLYALSAYVVGYYWCLMWLDAVYLLPLCILGLNRLLDKGDFKLYVITIALLLFTNYYIGGMVCIFVLFYFPALYFIKNRALGVKGCIRKIGQAVLCSLTGIMLSAFLLVPTFLSLQNTYYIDSTMPDEIHFYRPMLDVVNNLLPQMEVTTRAGAPNIYCGLFCIMMFAFFLICKSITLRKKLINCVMLAFLFVSLNTNVLDFIWHGFHFPNQIPFRYSFVVSFLLVIIAYEAFLNIREITPGNIAAMAAIGTVYVMLVEKIYTEEMMSSFVYVTLLLLFMYCGFLALYRSGKFDRKLMKLLLLVMVMFEMVISTSTAIGTVGSTDRIAYFEGSEDIKKLSREIQKTDGGFYRMEISESLTLNGPMLYNMPGVSQFSSTVNASVTNMMVAVGLEGGAPKNRYNYTVTDPVTDAILGMKYMISRGVPLSNDTAWEQIAGAGDALLYKNRYALEMGYMVEPAALYTWNFQQENPYDVLNDFVKLATDTDEDTFTRITDPVIAAAGASLGEDLGGYMECTADGTVENAKVEMTYTNPEDQQVYVYVKTKYADTVTAERGDGTVIYLPTDAGAVVSAGYLKKGETVKLTVLYEKDKTAPLNVYAYGMNQDVWENAYKLLSDEMIKVASHDDRHVAGTIEAKQDGVLVLSVPYEKGWTLKIDGEKQDPSLIGGAFIATPLEKGAHSIELNYWPDGLTLGILISIAGVLISAGMCVYRRRIVKKN